MPFEAVVQIRRTTFGHVCRHLSMEYAEQILFSVTQRTVMLTFISNNERHTQMQVLARLHNSYSLYLESSSVSHSVGATVGRLRSEASRREAG